MQLAAPVGGGSQVRLCELSLAHLARLFLDELPEFRRAMLDSLRQPLESGVISAVRADASVSFQSQVKLIAAKIACRCEYLSNAASGCSWAPRCAAK